MWIRLEESITIWDLAGISINDPMAPGAFSNQRTKHLNAFRGQKVVKTNKTGRI